MEPNQKPPSESEWTEEEKEEFFKSQDAMTFDFNSIPKQPPIQFSTSAWNGPLIDLDPNDPFGDMERLFPGSRSMGRNASTFTYDEPITLSKLMEMKAEVDSIFPPEAMKFKKGADMSRQTFTALGIPMESKDGGNTYFDFHKVSLIGIDVHIVDSIPFGKVEECRCEERAKENK
jgi:hypothetical protein